LLRRDIDWNKSSFIFNAIRDVFGKLFGIYICKVVSRK